MPSLEYDDDGNPVEGTTEEEDAVPAPAEAAAAVKSRTRKRKRTAKGKEMDADDSTDSGRDDTGEAFSTTLSAAKAFAEFKAIGGGIAVPEEATDVVDVFLGRSKVKAKRSAEEKGKWEKAALRKKRKKMTLLSNKPEVEVPNAEQVSDVYGVSKGRF
eukprot:TRINITY_DN32567_c0_g1_i1.p2 TRINITY_DN32567_c0_g1~~TRINITY_DN32567_c0_g1_i1.p2  ORF type:complete len:158 (+),score=47.01 TRINITY_DN32567_c0_g1_i1:56-529(+)